MTRIHSHKYSFALLGSVLLFLSTLDPSIVSSNTSSLPLVQFSDFQYLGGFRAPSQMLNGQDFSYGGSPIAYNPANNSLFVGNLGLKVTEISIPTPLNTSNEKTMPNASYVQQAFVDPTEGNFDQLTTASKHLYGLLVYNNRLIGASAPYYDAGYSQNLTHFSRSLSLTLPSFSGWSRVGDQGKSGFISGFMSHVPTEWQPALGGPVITGLCCIPIITRTSSGPAAFAFDPAQVGQPIVSAHPLLYYDANHATLGNWLDTNINLNFSQSTNVGGVVIIPGTRSVLFFGSTGMGPPCYGVGTATQSLHGTLDPHGVTYCYDPMNAAKGTHGYPYRYQVWAYDLNDLAAVKSGVKQPWEVLPYGVWPWTFPTTNISQTTIGGVTYDTQRQILYISQTYADLGQYSRNPIFHSYKVNIGTSVSNPTPTPTPVPPPTPTPPQPTPTPPPATSLTCSLIPSNTFEACYFDNTNFTNLKVVRNESVINNDWGVSSPDSLVAPDTFSATWTGNFTFEAGTYKFTATTDDGMKVTVDNTVIIDKYFDQGPTTYTYSLPLTLGVHKVKVEYYENGGGAAAKVSWVKEVSTPSQTPIPGDINLDHTVNSLDFSIMNSMWLTSNSSSDLRVDGQVNSLDFAILSSNWGRSW